MAPIDGINNNNIFSMYGTQSVNPYIGGGKQQTPKVNPFVQVQPAQKTTEVLPGNSQEAISSIGAHGTKYDGKNVEYGKNISDGIGSTAQTQLGYNGVAGKRLEMIG